MHWRRLILAIALLLAVVLAAAAFLSRRNAAIAAALDAPAVWVYYDSSTTNSYRIASAIAKEGGRIRYASSWLHAVSAHVDANRIRKAPGVLRVRPVGHMYAAAPSGVVTAALQQQDTTLYGPNYTALRELGVPQAHGIRLGLTGAGVRVAIIDTGFETAHQAFASGSIVLQRDFINDDFVVRTEPGEPIGVRDQEVHGTWVWSIMAGNRPGQIIGPAHAADYLLAKVDVEPVHNGNLKADEDRWVQAVEWAGDNGARVIVSALAYREFADTTDYAFAVLNGDSTRATKIADLAAARDIVVVTAMGNTPGQSTAGFGSLYAPADADSVIAVGAVDAAGAVLFNSARGPNANSRVKPELVARGTNVHVAVSGDLTAYTTLNGGTSFATAFVGGAAVLFREFWPEFTAGKVREALMLSATNAQAPDNSRGWGVPNVASAVLFPEGLSTSGITSGLGIDAEVGGVLTTITPIFSWTLLFHPRLSPVRFRVELAADPQFNGIFQTDTISNAFSLALKQPIRPRSPFYWRVVAEADAGPGLPIIRRSTPAAGPFTMPDWVQLSVINAPGGTFVNTTRPEFIWNPLDAPLPNGPFQFELQIINVLRGTIVQSITTADTAVTLTPAQSLIPNVTYRWRVIARSATGVADTVESRGNFLVDTETDPPITSLYPSFPNPFPRVDLGISATRFWFDLATDSTRVVLTIHDQRGRLVRTLIPASCPPMNKGEYGRTEEPLPCPVAQTSWDGRNDRGTLMPRGVYIARLHANSTISTQRILFQPPR
ncbi:MAG: S8 family serine peptidase [Gemmatimonadota bacterium]